tara:strand:- start:308 stop:883 length:576 start_codon:yes stop_codon:yes gene_type:complete
MSKDNPDLLYGIDDFEYQDVENEESDKKTEDSEEVDYSIFGPLNGLKIASRNVDRNDPSLSKLERAALSYLDQTDTISGSYYDNKGQWEEDENRTLRFCFSIAHNEILCDEFGCSMAQLYKRANQLGLAANGEEFSTEHVMMVQNLINKGATDAHISEIMGIPLPSAAYSSSKAEMKEIQKKVNEFNPRLL